MDAETGTSMAEPLENRIKRGLLEKVEDPIDVTNYFVT